MPCRPVLRDVRRTARAVTAGRRAEWRRQTSLVLLSLLRAKSLPGSAPQAPGRAVARDHALLPSRDGRFVARARRACLRASARKAWQRLASLQLRLSAL